MAPTVLITGASQGIGKATALLFAQNGYDTILAARREEPLAQVAQEIQNLGRTALPISCDVKDPQQVNTLVDKALAQFGNVDVLINDAGIYISGPVESFSLEDWHQAIDTNLWGYIHTIHALLPHMLARGSGTIVNLASIGGKVPIPYLVPYCTSKFAVNGLTEAMHSELKPKGIHVCGIYPNVIKSSLMERAIFRGIDEEDAKARRQQLEQVISTPVVEKPEDVAKAVWDAVKNQKAEILVGSAGMSKAAYNVLPGFMQWIFRQGFKQKA